MATPAFSIGIDLGTTNCALAFEPLGGGDTKVLEIPQWAAAGTRTDAATLPSFLYLPTDAESATLGGDEAWVCGQLAKQKSAETPGRVVHSAKSWLGHHVLDRSKPFLPWHSDSLERRQHISPVEASAILLRYLRDSWNSQLPEHPFQDQEITITVPASFDPAAQKLTLEAAKQAGFPKRVRLIEEPQAVFYRWLEQHGEEAILPADRTSHVAVIDIGGGTSDFSLFEVTPGKPLPRLRRIAVSEHLLLGGDNIDLAIAHQVEQSLPEGTTLEPVQWNHLVAQCRELKERCLADERGELFDVAIPGRGSGLFGGTLSGQISRDQIESILLEGFFPACAADSSPLEAEAGLREFALPYAADSAITRYLAEFLHGRPALDAVLFNGGSLYPDLLRDRLLTQIAAWQDGKAPIDLGNREPELAVARGAARYGALVHHDKSRIEGGSARTFYLEVLTPDAGRQLVCLLPQGTEPGETFDIERPGLALTIGKPVQFQVYYSNRRSKDRAGALIRWDAREFHPLPPLQTTAKLADAHADRVSIKLSASLNELGLLQVQCLSTDPDSAHQWPLEFNLRAGDSAAGNTRPSADPEPDHEQLEAACKSLTTAFESAAGKRKKLSGNSILKQLEETIGKPKHEWNGALVRALWPALRECSSQCTSSPDHEESWLILAGYLLRPGYGLEGDAERIDELFQILADGTAHPGKRIAVQRHVTWRRVAGGLDAERQQAIFEEESPRLEGKKPPAELIRMIGAFERLDLSVKERLADTFTERAVTQLRANQYADPWLVALGLLLNRAPLFAGKTAILPASCVSRCFEALQDFDWSSPICREIPTLFLRAARVIDHESLDLPKAVRNQIATKLDHAEVSAVKVERVRQYVAVEASDHAGLFGEALPPGLVLDVG